MQTLIEAVVHAFYEKAVNDVLIGYHFARFRGPLALSHHLVRICAFWEMQLTGKSPPTLAGEPPFHLLFTHLQLSLKRGELGRWIVLFHQTLDELESQLTAEELESVHPLVLEWKKRIALFEERFKAHPQMFK